MRKLLIKYLPFLGKYKRLAKGVKDIYFSNRQTFSQYGEDQIIFNLIEKKNIKGYPYIDIGANHPTDISNTYLLYKKGMKGITIDPNFELIKLHKTFRPRDKQFQIGCGNENTILNFHISKTPVISSFQKLENEEYKTDYIPVLKLDDALKHENIEKISILSIDVEGMNLQVLEGADETLKKTQLICIEFDDDNDKEKIIKYLSLQFNLVHQIQCNLIFERF